MVSRWSPKPEAGVRFSSPLPIITRSIAQSGSASRLGREGRGFKSYYSDQLRKIARVVDRNSLLRS